MSPTLCYEVTGRVARLQLDRPERGNAITLDMPAELAACVERANLDPAVHVIALSGRGAGFCSGYDLAAAASAWDAEAGGGWTTTAPPGSPLDPAVQARNHDPSQVWDPALDYAMMSRNVRGFMSLFHSDKPVICKVHGYCVGGGTDLALCADLLVVEDKAKIGYPPARVWGVPTTALWVHRIGIERAKRLLFTGDCLSGEEAVTWGLALECAPAEQLDLRFEALLERIARLPINQLVMMKLLLNQTVAATGLHSTQVLGTVFDGMARHTPEGHAFLQRAIEAGFKEAVRERDAPFGDLGRSTYKGGAQPSRPPRRVSVREGYDRWAAIYDAEANPLVALEQPVVADLAGAVRGLRLLDVGCGTGRHAFRLAAQGARVVALDLSPEMLARARAKPAAASVRFVQHDATTPLPVRDGSFDGVVSGLVLEHLRALAPFFAELARVCRPGGFIIVTAMHPAMWLRGISARFIEPSTGEEVRPESHDHRLSDMVMTALGAGLRLVHLSEHAPDAELAARVPRAARYVGWPMLVAMKLGR